MLSVIQIPFRHNTLYMHPGSYRIPNNQALNIGRSKNSPLVAGLQPTELIDQGIL